MTADQLARYIRRADGFLTHWSQANAALAPKALTLARGYTRAQFQTDRDALAQATTAITDADNTRQTARAHRKTAQNDLRERLRQFRGSVLGRLDGSDIAAALPILPVVSAAPEAWTRAFDDMAGLWTRIDADPPAGFTPPLTLAGNYARAAFVAELAALKTAYAALADAERAATIARAERAAQAKALRARFVAYRKAAQGVFAQDHPLIASLPTL